MSQHTVVIGGGHNGLIAANYLARSGIQVTLLEARGSLGGVVGRHEFMPGYSSALSNSIGSFEASIFTDLELEKFGLRFARPEVTLLHPMEDSLFIGWRDRQRVADQMERFAPGEAARHHELVEMLDELGAQSGLSLWDAPESTASALAKMNAESRSKFRRYMIDGSLNSLLDEALASSQAKSMMMMLALNGQLISPSDPGSAFGLLLRPISRASNSEDPLGTQSAALRGSVGLPIGSMGSIIDALALSAHSYGVNVRLGARVVEIELDDDERPIAIALESGERISGFTSLISTVESTVLERLLPAIPAGEVTWPHRPQGSAFKIAVAVDGLPEVAGAPEGMPVEHLLAAQFRIGPTPEYISAAVEDGIAGRPATSPLIWGLFPSLSSPGLAPPGKHLLSLNVWHAPYSLGKQFWDENGDAFALNCIRQVERLMPNLSNHIEQLSWLGPHDIEAEFNLTASNITHGDMDAELLLDGRGSAGLAGQLLKRNIVLGGSDAWPGGYVTGAPGKNAAFKVIHQL